MKKIILTFTLLLLAYSASVSQRRLQIVSDPIPHAIDLQIVENSVYVAGYEGTTLGRYDGVYSTIPYPLDGGLPLKYDNDYEDNLLSYNASLYLVLHNNSGERLFYQYNSDGFHRFPLELFSNIITYRDKIYMLARRPGGTIGLFSYNGFTSTLLEEAPALTVTTTLHSLRVGGDNLYIQGCWSPEGPWYFLQYTGSAVRMVSGLPDFRITETLTVGGTDDSYFKFGNGEVFFHDGSRFIQTSPSPDPEDPIGRSGLFLSGNVLYFQEDDRHSPTKLVRCVDGTCTEIPVPAGSLIDGSQNAVYRDELYFPVRVGSRDYLYRYNGAAFTRVFEFPEPIHWPELKVRDGKLLIVSRASSTDTAYEYDGTYFISIMSPDEELIHRSGESTPDYHTWSLAYADETVPAPDRIRWVLAIEVPGGPASIIPERLREYDNFWSGPYSPERDWCWTGIDIGWVLPICTRPPCGDPPEEVQTTLTDIKGELAYSKIFNKPFSTEFPFEDKEPYTLSVSVGKGDKFDPVLLFDNDLVNKGIENISFDMYPKKDYFYLKVATRKQQEVPISLTLRSTKGESLWQENFTAPMDKLIQAYVSEPGAYLQVSLQQKTSGVSYYPNPFKENLTLEVAKGTAPVSISLSDLNGKVIFQTKIPEPGKHSINVGSQKSGLYILTIIEGNLTRRELVQIE